MTTTDLTAVPAAGPASTDLTITDGQTSFTQMQVAALHQLGVQEASDGDLQVFFHVCKRTGLDPFARQIYMLGRRTKDANDNWVTKQTIQTGIDGYRLIGRRAADRAKVRASVSAPQWADHEGRWHDVWLTGSAPPPAAARVVVYRDGDEFPGVAIFNEYAQTTRRGDLTSMWRQRPAGQLAKCAEALAWRMAFPQDLANVYVEDEMHQASNPDPVELEQQPRRRQARAADFAAAPAEQPEPDAAPAVEPDEWQAVSDEQVERILVLAHELDLNDVQLLVGLRKITGRRDLDAPRGLSDAEAVRVIASLEEKAAALPPVDGDVVDGELDEGARS